MAEAKKPNHEDPRPNPTHPPVYAIPLEVEYDEFGLPIQQMPPAPVPSFPLAMSSRPKILSYPEAPGAVKASISAPGTRHVGLPEVHSSRLANGVESRDTSTNQSTTRDSMALDQHGVTGDATVKTAIRNLDGSVDSKPASRPASRGQSRVTNGHSRDPSVASATNVMSEFSHQGLTAKHEEEEVDDDGGWQEMPAFAPYDLYDDNDRLIAREHDDTKDERYRYAGLGGAGKGYTQVIMDDDAQSATSMDENTKYLFNQGHSTSVDEEQRDAISQMQATKHLLTEGQRIAYAGLVRLDISTIVLDAEAERTTAKTKKEVLLAAESDRKWGQKMMIRLYSHMDISSDEQIMIEQLGQHGVVAGDLTPVLMANSMVPNPMAESPITDTRPEAKDDNSPPASQTPVCSPSTHPSTEKSHAGEAQQERQQLPDPPYEQSSNGTAPLPAVRTLEELPKSSNIDIDIRWTVLCDLFLVLISDSIYDARSRLLMERVGKSLSIPWVDICRFEKRVTDALEMQQAAEKENWNEDEHLETRRRLARHRKYLMMGLATVGGGLVIGLSAGLLAPVIGAGLAAGFTTIGVVGTNGFLAGSAGAAIITSGAAASGGFIGGKAANRRMGSVRTFEYKPLHNNKRVNLIVTISGWLTGKVDDVRLPYSTVDSVMGDLYSVLWEPELLTSMGDTINILATEALTQGLQQILGNTILVGLMAALQLPIVLTKLSYLIDNPWAVSLDRAMAAGLILADSIIDRNLGTRPITLVGYSLGARVIFSCLRELARKGAYGLVQNAYLFGSPVVVKEDEYIRIRTVVRGRFVNGYNRNDWILGYLFRLTNGGIRRVAGLAPIELPWIENMDAAEFVVGHMDYRTAMPRMLRECGWIVERDDFNEIEDADPDNHTTRQRELMSEIEGARKDLEQQERSTSGKVFGFFGRRKKALERQEWEVYEDAAATAAAAAAAGPTKSKVTSGSEQDEDVDSESKKLNDLGDGEVDDSEDVFFDVDAIRAELSREVEPEDLQVRELKSTLPPMRLDAREKSPLQPQRPRDRLRQTNLSPSHARSSPTESVSNALPISPSPLSAGRAPSGRVRLPSAYLAAEDDTDDAIQLTFNTTFHPEPKLPSVPPPPPPPPKDRFPFREGATMDLAPAPERRAKPAVNPWAHVDPDDEDFGREREIELSFA